MSIFRPLRSWSKPGPAHTIGKGGHFLRTGGKSRAETCPGHCCQGPVWEEARQLLLSPARGRNWLCLLPPSFPVPRYPYVPSPPASPEHRETHGWWGTQRRILQPSGNRERIGLILCSWTPQGSANIPRQAPARPVHCKSRSGKL